MRKKIICIVNTREVDHGLSLVLEELKDHSFVTRYLYKEKTERVKGGKDTYYQRILSKDMPFLYLSSEEIVQESEFFEPQWKSEWDVVLISDDYKDFDNLIAQINQEHAVLYHRFPLGLGEELKASNCIVSKKGTHTQGNDNYGHLEHLIESYNPVDGTFEDSKFSRVICDILFWFGIEPKLEAALELLHACLTPAGAKKVKESGFPSELGVREEVISLSGMNDPFSKKYLEKLTEIRDQLLPLKN